MWKIKKLAKLKFFLQVRDQQKGNLFGDCARETEKNISHSIQKESEYNPLVRNKYVDLNVRFNNIKEF